MSRANPERTMNAIRNALLGANGRKEALDVLTRALERTWEAGHKTGFVDGVSDANDDNPKPPKPNPYRTS